MYLGVKMVIAKSIARIHKGNLVNHGIIPLVFDNPADYDRIEQGDELEATGLIDQLRDRFVEIRDVTRGFAFKARLELSEGEVEVIINGGQLRTIKKQLREMGKLDPASC